MDERTKYNQHFLQNMYTLDVRKFFGNSPFHVSQDLMSLIPSFSLSKGGCQLMLVNRVSMP